MAASHRLRFSAGLLALSVLIALVVWQGSFTVGDYGPETPEQTYVFWALSSLIFLLTVLLAFILFRDAVKLYFARRAGVEGARIRTKILVGALGLVFLPTVFLFLWSVEVLNRNLDKWFSRPAERIKLNLSEIGSILEVETQRRTELAARWLGEAARAGDAEGMVEFGRLHRGGIGVEQDSVAAYVWFNRAAAHMHMEGVQERDSIAIKLAPEDPEKQHVHQDVQQVAMKEHVGEELPQPPFFHHPSRHQGQYRLHQGYAQRHRRQDGAGHLLHNEHAEVGRQQPLDRRRHARHGQADPRCPPLLVHATDRALLQLHGHRHPRSDA